MKTPGNTLFATYSTCLNTTEVLRLNQTAIGTSDFLLDGCILEIQQKKIIVSVKNNSNYLSMEHILMFLSCALFNYCLLIYQTMLL